MVKTKSKPSSKSNSKPPKLKRLKSSKNWTDVEGARAIDRKLTRRFLRHHSRKAIGVLKDADGNPRPIKPRDDPEDRRRTQFYIPDLKRLAKLPVVGSKPFKHKGKVLMKVTAGPDHCGIAGETLWYWINKACNWVPGGKLPTYDVWAWNDEGARFRILEIECVSDKQIKGIRRRMKRAQARVSRLLDTPESSDKLPLPPRLTLTEGATLYSIPREALEGACNGNGRLHEINLHAKKEKRTAAGTAGRFELRTVSTDALIRVARLRKYSSELREKHKDDLIPLSEVPNKAGCSHATVNNRLPELKKERVVWPDAEGHERLRTLIWRSELPRLNRKPRNKSQANSGIDWLGGRLSEGSELRVDVVRAARRRGFSDSTIQRASLELGVRSRGTAAYRRVVWSLPERVTAKYRGNGRQIEAAAEHQQTPKEATIDELCTEVFSEMSPHPSRNWIYRRIASSAFLKPNKMNQYPRDPAKAFLLRLKSFLQQDPNRWEDKGGIAHISRALAVEQNGLRSMTECDHILRDNPQIKTKLVARPTTTTNFECTPRTYIQTKKWLMIPKEQFTEAVLSWKGNGEQTPAPDDAQKPAPPGEASTAVMESKPKAKLSDIPPLATDSEEWCKQRRAAELSGSEIRTLANLRWEGRKSADHCSGIDGYGYMWRKVRSSSLVVWYYTPSLPSG